VSWRLSPHVAWQRIAGEAVIVDLRSGKSLGLNGTASYIWEQAAELRTTDEIAAAVATRYDVDLQAAAEDVRNLLAKLRDLALVQE
jgi:hypothetical protein